MIWFFDHDQQRAFLPLTMGNANDCGLLNTGVTHRCVLKVDGRDPLASRLDHILGSIRDLNKAIGVYVRNITRTEPTFRIQCRACFAAKVARQDPRTSDTNFSNRFAIVRQTLALCTKDRHFHTKNSASLTRLHIKAGLHIDAMVLGQQVGHGCNRAGFGHAPSLNDKDAQEVFKFLNHGPRCCRTTYHHALEFQGLEVHIL